MAKAAEFGASIETPPVESIPIPRSFSRNWAVDEIEFPQVISFEVEVPEGFEVAGVSYPPPTVVRIVGEPWDATIRTDVNSWLGASGRLTLSVTVRNSGRLRP